jgi:hypothetical protein
MVYDLQTQAVSPCLRSELYEWLLEMLRDNCQFPVMTGARRLVCSFMANAGGDEIICLLQAGLAAEIEE